MTNEREQVQQFIMPWANWLYFPEEIRFKAFERFSIMSEEPDISEVLAGRYVAHILGRIKAGKTEQANRL